MARTTTKKRTPRTTATLLERVCNYAWSTGDPDRMKLLNYLEGYGAAAPAKPQRQPTAAAPSTPRRSRKTAAVTGKPPPLTVDRIASMIPQNGATDASIRKQLTNEGYGARIISRMLNRSAQERGFVLENGRWSQPQEARTGTHG